jgi:hypothetical protein
MRLSVYLALAFMAGYSAAFPQDASADSVNGNSTNLLESLNRNPRGQCPPVWSQISKDLTAMFVSGGQCNDDARAAIRAVFHVRLSEKL